MFLIDPTELQSAIGLKGSQGTSALETDQIKAILVTLLPAIEGPLNIATLTYVSNQDRFRVPDAKISFPPRQILRLSNAFLDIPTVEVTDPSGAVVPVENLLIDAHYGTIELLTPIGGEYRVNYRSGFKLPAIPAPTADNPNPEIPLQVFIGVPQFLKSAMTLQFVSWARTALIAARLPKDITMLEASMTLQRKIANNLYSVYDRPRAGVLWPTYHAQS